MSKVYKLWVEVEEHDHETDLYQRIGEPVEIGIYDNEKDAVAAAENLDMMLGDNGAGMASVKGNGA